jgi:hypothetical protein
VKPQSTVRRRGLLIAATAALAAIGAHAQQALRQLKAEGLNRYRAQSLAEAREP